MLSKDQPVVWRLIKEPLGGSSFLLSSFNNSNPWSWSHCTSPCCSHNITRIYALSWNVQLYGKRSHVSEEELVLVSVCYDRICSTVILISNPTSSGELPQECKCEQHVRGALVCTAASQLLLSWSSSSHFIHHHLANLG